MRLGHAKLGHFRILDLHPWAKGATTALCLLTLAILMAAAAYPETTQASAGAAPSVECKPPCVCKCPTPPTPPEPTHPEMRLCANGTTFVWCDGHSPAFQYRERGMCCNWGRDTGWPLVTPETLAESATLGSVTMMEVRPGPFNKGNEPDWYQVGGAYVQGPDGRADLTQWNEPFWAAYRAIPPKSGSHGIVDRVSIVSFWGCRTEQWATYDDPAYPPVPMPWVAAGNIQGENHCNVSGDTLDPVQKAWVKKVVAESCKNGNVVYEDGTEPAANEGYRGEFSLAIERAVREAEAENGCARHLWGSNATKDTPLGVLMDAGVLNFMTVHDLGFMYEDPGNGIPTMNTEYNPEPAWSALTVHANYCFEKRVGIYYSAWDDSQSRSEHMATLALNAQGCSAKDSTGCPYDVLPLGRIDCRRYKPMPMGELFDCTPKNVNGQPILEEGNGSRILCEFSVGAPDGLPEHGFPTFWVEGGHLIGKPNPWQFVVTAPGKLHCKVPKYPDEDLCGGMPVWP